ncbi:Glutamate dehydrogenase, NAD-specific, partial [Cynara cardunculus var. scolymus]
MATKKNINSIDQSKTHGIANIQEKLTDPITGIGVFRGIRTSITPTLICVPTITAAPYATASSGFTLLHNSLPSKNSCNICWTLGILVEPPTRITSFTHDFSIFASFKQVSRVLMQLSNEPIFSSSNLARLNFMEKSIPSCKQSSSIENPFCFLTRKSQPPHSSLVPVQVLIPSLFEFANTVIHHAAIKILASQMSVTSNSFHLKSTLFRDCQQRDIKSATTQIKDDHIHLANN